MTWLVRLARTLPLLALAALLAVPGANSRRVVFEPWGACTGTSVTEACTETTADVGDQLAVLGRAEKANASALSAALRSNRDCQVSPRPDVIPGSFLVRTADAQMRPTVRRAAWGHTAGGWVVGSCYGTDPQP